MNQAYRWISTGQDGGADRIAGELVHAQTRSGVEIDVVMLHTREFAYLIRIRYEGRHQLLVADLILSSLYCEIDS